MGLDERARALERLPERRESRYSLGLHALGKRLPSRFVDMG